MSDVIFTDNSLEFLGKNAIMTDTMMALMAANIEIQIKTSGRTPFKTGGLRSSVRHSKKGPMSYQVTADKEYAAAQEVGTTRGHQITHYTTPGTGKGWFKDAIKNVKDRAPEFAKTAAKAAGIEL